MSDSTPPPSSSDSRLTTSNARTASSASTVAPFVRGGTMLVLVAIAYAAASHGAFYRRELWISAILVFLGLVFSVLERGLSRSEADGPVIVAVVLAVWYLISAAIAHDLAGAVPAVVLLSAMATTVVIVRRSDGPEQRLLLVGLLGVGVLIAISGWVGVAWRQSPRALDDGVLWRAASTITYANATGGILAALAVLALGAFVTERKQSAYSLVTYLLVVGLLATASRAGLIGFAAGLATLTVWTRGRVILRSWAIFAGALFAFAALLPSMPSADQPRPALALVGLALGAVISVAPARLLGVVAVGVTIALVTMSGLRHSAIDAGSRVREGRITTKSSDRSHELHAALELARTHAIAGVGPGRVDLAWDVATPVPQTVHVAYAHDEYLQVLAETGIIGEILLAAGFATVAAAIWRARGDARIVARVGCVSALVGLCVHSSMDFLWHVPVIPLTGAVLVGALLPHPDTRI